MCNTPKIDICSIHICLFGKFTIEFSSEDKIYTGGSKSNQILAILSLNPGKKISRNHIISCIWPSHNQPAFRTALCRLKSHFKQNALISETNHLYLNKDLVSSDVSQFLNFISCEKYDKAFNLYNGPFMFGHDSLWIISERARLEEKYVDLCRKYANSLIMQSNNDKAINIINKALTFHPQNIELQKFLIKAYLHNGQHAIAIEIYNNITKFDNNSSVELRSLISDFYFSQCHIGDISITNSNIPNNNSEFIGRQSELHELYQQLTKNNSKFIHICGPGGVGKSRLAIEGAKRTSDHFQNAIWYVSLAGASTLNEIVHLIFNSIYQSESTPQFRDLTPNAILDHVVTLLKNRKSLLILDNIEQISKFHINEVLQKLIKGTKYLKIVTTSRKRNPFSLGFEITLSPFGFTDYISDSEIASHPAIRLFVNRSAQSNISTLSKKELHNILSLCKQLDGLPLAIEWVAARTSKFSTSDIIQNLNDFLHSNDTLSHSYINHHCNLKSVFYWSYNLLTETEKMFLKKLLIFPSSFTLDAAVCIFPNIEVISLIDSLIEVSLLCKYQSQGIDRFYLLQITKSYCTNDPSNLAVESDKRLLSYYYLNLNPANLEDHDNLALALDWFTYNEPNTQHCIRISQRLLRSWFRRGQIQSALDSAENIYKSISKNNFSTELSKFSLRLLYTCILYPPQDDFSNKFINILSDSFNHTGNYSDIYNHIYIKSIKLMFNGELNNAITHLNIVRRIGSLKYASEPTLIFALLNLGGCHGRLRDYKTALYYWQLALSFAEQHQFGNDIHAISIRMVSFGLLMTGNTNLCYKNIIQSQNIFTILGLQFHINEHRISWIDAEYYRTTGDTSKSLSIHKESLYFLLRYNDVSSIFEHLRGLATTLFSILEYINTISVLIFIRQYTNKFHFKLSDFEINEMKSLYEEALGMINHDTEQSTICTSDRLEDLLERVFVTAQLGQFP